MTTRYEREIDELIRRQQLEGKIPAIVIRPDPRTPEDKLRHDFRCVRCGKYVIDSRECTDADFENAQKRIRKLGIDAGKLDKFRAKLHLAYGVPFLDALNGRMGKRFCYDCEIDMYLETV